MAGRSKFIPCGFSLRYIYITGSNAYLLSSEFATYLSGRYVEIKMLPLSFKEFIDFHGYKLIERKSPAGKTVKKIIDSEENMYNTEELFEAYLKFGGMPGIADVGLDADKAMTLLDGVYSTVVMRDILEREKRKGQRQRTERSVSYKKSKMRTRFSKQRTDSGQTVFLLK